MLINYDRITGYNTEIIYVSPDGISRTREFLSQAEHPLRFPVLTDSTHTVIDLYQVKRWLHPQRPEVLPGTFLIDYRGILQYKHIGQSPSDRPTVRQLEEILQKMRREP